MEAKTIKNGFVVGLLSLGLSSCGSFTSVGYDDGVYGEKPVREYISYNREESNQQQVAQNQSYKEYLSGKAQQFNDFERQNTMPPAYTPLANIDNYSTPSQANGQVVTGDQYNYYYGNNNAGYSDGYRAGWGDNSRAKEVNIYNYSGFYDPYWSWNYGSTYYWGISPYRYSYYDYYRPYTGWSVGLSFGYYDPWYYNRYYYPYYGYYYPTYYYYGDGYYANRGYVWNRNYSYTPQRRGDANRYYQGAPNRSYSSRGQNNTYTPGQYRRSQNNNNSPYYRPTPSSPSRTYSPSSPSRTYTPSSPSRTYTPSTPSTPSSPSRRRDF